MRRLILLLVALLAALLLMLQPVSAQEARVTVTVLASSLKVRAAPSTDAEQLGLLKCGTKVVISGVSADGYWLHFSFWGAEAWLGSAPELVKVEGDLTALPVMEAETAVTLKLLDYGITPVVPPPGSPFQLRLNLSSSASTGAFVVAGALAESFFLLPVQFLSGMSDHEVEVSLTAPVSTGWHELHLALDLEHALGQGTEQTLKVFVDYPRRSLGRLRFESYTNYNPDGGAPDLSWDGDSLQVLGEAKLGLMPYSLSEAHYDALLAEREHIPRSELKRGTLIALWTNEGRRGLLWVQALEGDALVVEVFLYEGGIHAD